MEERKLTSWFRGEIGAAFAIGCFVAGIFTYFMSPVNGLKVDMAVLQTQVTNIKNNDLVHIFQEQTAASTRIQDIQTQLSSQAVTLGEIKALIQRK